MSQSAVQKFSDDLTPPQEPLDPVALSALLASRLCHDLINPVGALGSGLEVLEDESMDESMKEAASDLIKTGGAKSVSLLKYARLAYGAAGGRGVELPMEEAEQILRDLFQWAKADLEWTVPPIHALKEKVKAVMILTHYAADCVPRGGVVRVANEGDDLFTVEAEGKRALLQDDLPAALAGDHTEMKPKFAPAYIAGLLARELGGSVTVSRESDEKVVFKAQFSS